jgi:hypothetical protein
MKVTCSYKMLVDFQWTTWYYILEDNTLLFSNHVSSQRIIFCQMVEKIKQIAAVSLSYVYRLVGYLFILLNPIRLVHFIFDRNTFYCKYLYSIERPTLEIVEPNTKKYLSS